MVVDIADRDSSAMLQEVTSVSFVTTKGEVLRTQKPATLVDKKEYVLWPDLLHESEFTFILQRVSEIY